MKIKLVEVSLSKEERRIVDEYGNSASTWARIGITAELQSGDTLAACIDQLRQDIQPHVDDWLLRQGGYITPPVETIEEIQDRLEELFGTKVSATEVSPNGDGSAEDEDEIPL